MTIAEFNSDSLNDAAYDCPECPGPESAYLICSTPRSGSTLLATGLWQTGLAGVPHEYFNQRHIGAILRRANCDSLQHYIEWVRTHRVCNGVCGIKMHFSQFRQFFLARGANPHDLESAFPNIRYIYIFRRDRLGQAISAVKSHQTGQWMATDPLCGSARYDFEAILWQLRSLQREDQGWQRWFRETGVRPLSIAYEQLVAAYDLWIRTVLQLIGVDCALDTPIRQPVIHKQRNGFSDEWRQRFIEDLRQAGRLDIGQRELVCDPDELETDNVRADSREERAYSDHQEFDLIQAHLLELRGERHRLEDFVGSLHTELNRLSSVVQEQFLRINNLQTDPASGTHRLENFVGSLHTELNRLSSVVQEQFLRINNLEAHFASRLG